MKPPAWIPLLLMLAGYPLIGIGFAWDLHDAKIASLTLLYAATALWLVRIGCDVRQIRRLRTLIREEKARS